MKKIKVLKINLIISIIFAIASSVTCVFELIYTGETHVENIYEVIQLIMLFFTAMFITFFLGLNMLCLPIYIVQLFSKTKTIVNKQYVDTKQSIYTRELPETYNSVIAGELLDFKSNIRNEYLAGVIELISKGYITEYEDKLVVNDKKSRDNLLKNEKYILDACAKMDKNFMYSYEFFEKIREDMFDLKLYKENKFLKKTINKITYILEKQENRINPGVCVSIAIYALILFLVFLLFLAQYNFMLTCFIVVVMYILMLTIIRKNKLTKIGELEKEKIGKLKLFLDKETSFKDKTEEERKIWGRYSAFAVALGCNEEFKEETYAKVFNCYDKPNIQTVHSKK